MMSSFRRPVAVETAAPSLPCCSLREKLREAQESATEARRALLEVEGASEAGAALLDRRRRDVEALEGVDLAVAQLIAAQLRSGDVTLGKLPAALAESKRALTEAREALAAAEMGTEIIERELRETQSAAAAAGAEIEVALDEIVRQELVEVVERMRVHEAEAGRLRMMLLAAPRLAGALALIALDDIHAASVRAAERAGHKPDPAKWAAYRAALVANPDKSFDLS